MSRTKPRRLRLSLKGLKRRDLRILRRQHQKWLKTIQPLLDATEASTQITGDDLKIIVR
jgi:hypothetical protein